MSKETTGKILILFWLILLFFLMGIFAIYRLTEQKLNFWNSIHFPDNIIDLNFEFHGNRVIPEPSYFVKENDAEFIAWPGRRQDQIFDITNQTDVLLLQKWIISRNREYGTWNDINFDEMKFKRNKN